MSSSFVHAPKVQTTGSPVDVWLKAYWDTATFVGEGSIATETGDLPVSQTAVVFRNFRPVTGTPGAYFADPVSLVEYRPAMAASFSSGHHPTVRGSDVVVPLGTPASLEPETANAYVLQQAARNWVTGGQNRGDMSMEHLITLYYGALQALVYATGTAHTKETQSKWLSAVCALSRAFAAVCRLYPAAQRVSEALVYTHGVNDMLQKALAHVFTGVPIDAVTGYEMMTTIVRRNLRTGKMFTGLVPGPFVVFMLTPLLKGVLDGTTTAAELQTQFNVRGTALVSELQAIQTARTAAVAEGGWHVVTHRKAIPFWDTEDKLGLQADCLSALSKAAGFPLTTEQAQKLLLHCTGTEASARVPWADWGVLPAPPALGCRVSTGRYGIHRVPSGRFDPMTHHSRICPLDDHTFEVFSYKGVEWSAIQFHTPGTYTVHAHDLGIAKVAAGDTRGEELVANWRLTVGNVVLPGDEAGYALSGMRHAAHGGYTPATPLRLDAPFEVVVGFSTVELRQGGTVFCSLERKKYKDALLAFKNLWFRVEYVPLEPKAPRAVPATYGGTTAKVGGGAATGTTSTPTPMGTWAAIAAKAPRPF